MGNHDDQILRLTSQLNKQQSEYKKLNTAINKNTKSLKLEIVDDDI